MGAETVEVGAETVEVGAETVEETVEVVEETVEVVEEEVEVGEEMGVDMNSRTHKMNKRHTFCRNQMHPAHTPQSSNDNCIAAAHTSRLKSMVDCRTNFVARAAHGLREV